METQEKSRSAREELEDLLLWSRHYGYQAEVWEKADAPETAAECRRLAKHYSGLAIAKARALTPGLAMPPQEEA